LLLAIVSALPRHLQEFRRLAPETWYASDVNTAIRISMAAKIKDENVGRKQLSLNRDGEGRDDNRVAAKRRR
jgi:hypothetical protein